VTSITVREPQSCDVRHIGQTMLALLLASARLGRLCIPLLNLFVGIHAKISSVIFMFSVVAGFHSYYISAVCYPCRSFKHCRNWRRCKL